MDTVLVSIETGIEVCFAGSIKVGRHPRSDLPISDPAVSGQWTRNCPVERLPTAYLGFILNAPGVYRQDMYGSWYLQYYTNPRMFQYVIYPYGRSTLYMDWFGSPQQLNPVTWRAYY